MTVTVRNKTPLVVPLAVRRKAGFKSGQEIEFRASGGVITIVPKLPNADDEYTPEQRRIVDAQLAEGLADIKAGRTFGPFDSAEEMIAHMKAQLKRSAPRPRTRRPR
ncbi:MAG: AbrB/MazE/SpoVT family DNA-binding domain-containing protein [Bryobacteraceae bacterium]|jgi:bifunctional DNA-binding transcriptional regulator/antitoxin component of YhaV-PrlF toxin-antitoxin module